MTPSEPGKPLSRPQWWLLFIVATYVMSLWFQTFRVFTVSPTWGNALAWLGAMVLLVLVVSVLVYDSYVQEKAKGRVQKPVALFEWILSKQRHRPSSNPGDWK